jgi:hypothetical protein
VAPDDFPLDYRIRNAAAEREEDEFAGENRLEPDPDDEELTTVLADEDDGDDLDGDEEPDTVSILGHAPGIATGFGSGVAQDIGPEGFSISDNPLEVAAGKLDYPISTERLSDEARGLRDVDEMGSEAELERLAERGSAIAESLPSKRRRRSRT